MEAFGSVIWVLNFAGIWSKVKVVMEGEACLRAAGWSELDYISRACARKRLAGLLNLSRGRQLRSCFVSNCVLGPTGMKRLEYWKIFHAFFFHRLKCCSDIQLHLLVHSHSYDPSQCHSRRERQNLIFMPSAVWFCKGLVDMKGSCSLLFLRYPPSNVLKKDYDSSEISESISHMTLKMPLRCLHAH